MFIRAQSRVLRNKWQCSRIRVRAWIWLHSYEFSTRVHRNDYECSDLHIKGIRSSHICSLCLKWSSHVCSGALMIEHLWMFHPYIVRKTRTYDGSLACISHFDLLLNCSLNRIETILALLIIINGFDSRQRSKKPLYSILTKFTIGIWILIECPVTLQHDRVRDNVMWSV